MKEEPDTPEDKDYLCSRAIVLARAGSSRVSGLWSPPRLSTVALQAATCPKQQYLCPLLSTDLCWGGGEPPTVAALALV